MLKVRENLWRIWSLIALCVLAGALAVGAQNGPNNRATSELGLPTFSLDPDAREIELGRKLFLDRRLSANGKMACATCHVPSEGFTQSSRPTPQGRDGRPLRRNAPSLLNVAFAHPLMHDGAAPSLEVQILTPLLAPDEMANASFDALEARLAGIPDYAEAFNRVFGAAPTMATIGKSLAAYQRSLIAGDAPFDRWRYRGDATAMPEAARRGFAMFTGRGGCSGCHTIGETHALLSDNQMHNTGVGARLRLADDTSISRHDGATIDFARAGDRGRNEITGRADDLFKYRTPSLRNVAITAPYMHDGSIATLEEVVRFYDRGGIANANLDPAIKPLGLSDDDVRDLVAFLTSLTGSSVDKLSADAQRP